MKKIIFLLLLSSCSVNKDNIFYTKSVKKSIHNLEVLESWIHRDLENGDIPKKLASIETKEITIEDSPASSETISML